MSFRSTVTYTKQSKLDITKYEPTEPFHYLNVWAIKELKEELENGVSSAISALDSQMKGWKPVVEGKETQYGIHASKPNAGLWYQRVYVK